MENAASYGISFAGLMPYKFVPFFCNVLLRPAIGPAIGPANSNSKQCLGELVLSDAVFLTTEKATCLSK
jgi:hypothetical protein